MEITLEEIKKLEILSAISLTDEKRKSMLQDFKQIAMLIEQVKQADIDTKVEYARVLETNELREDEIFQSMPNNEALANAPEKDEGSFVVPKVVE